MCVCVCVWQQMTQSPISFIWHVEETMLGQVFKSSTTDKGNKKGLDKNITCSTENCFVNLFSVSTIFLFPGVSPFCHIYSLVLQWTYQMPSHPKFSECLLPTKVLITHIHLEILKREWGKKGKTKPCSFQCSKWSYKFSFVKINVSLY